MLVEGNEIVNDDGKVAAIMNRYFTNITKHMNVKAKQNQSPSRTTENSGTFKNHMSVQRIMLANFHSYRTLNVRKEILNFFSRRQLKMVILQPKF